MLTRKRSHRRLRRQRSHSRYKSLSLLKATFTFFQEVMIDAAVETLMSEKVDSSVDLYYSIL